MSVKIEILDYVFEENNSAQINPDYLLNSPSSWTQSPAGSWDFVVGSATKNLGTGQGYIRTPMNFVEGEKYKLIVILVDVNSGSFLLANHLAGNANSDPITTSGIHTIEWVQGANNLTQLSLFGSSTFDGKVLVAAVFAVSDIDWSKSVVGELDITDHSNFPLALTFQISDFKEITSTSGNYSKTFKIPATKNNNNVLKHPFSSGIVSNIPRDYNPETAQESNISEKKPCRIIFNGLYSMVGLIQVDGVGGYGETASYYNCVFFGNNISWSSKMENLYLNTINWGALGEDIVYQKQEIMDTWQYADCSNSAGSPIVYPITSYGDYNESGRDRTIQLLDKFSGSSASYFGFKDESTSYDTPPPSSDWRPAVFVKTTFYKIFKNLGYRIESEFMETQMFKQLVWLLPNFKYNNIDDRTIDYGYGNSFTGEGFIDDITVTSPSSAPSGASNTYLDLNLNNAGSDFVLNSDRNNTGWNITDGHLEIQEYGYYQIDLKGFGAFYNASPYSTAGTRTIDFMEIQVLVETVGQTGFGLIGSKQNNGGSQVVNSSNIRGAMNFPDMQIKRYLNKGDKIMIQIRVKFRATVGSSQMDIYFFGSSFPTANSLSDGANGTFDVNIIPSPVSWGQTYNLNDVINPEYKQLDFIKGVAHAFNLKMVTDENSKLVTIEPYDSFYKPLADALDWTSKMDRSKQIDDKWVLTDLKRTLIFKYKSDDKDAVVKDRGENIFEGIQDEYPYKTELPDTFIKGETTFENPFFAGSYNAKDIDSLISYEFFDTAYSACLWEESVSASQTNRPVKGFDFLPRLLYWNKYSPNVLVNNGQVPKVANVQTWANATKAIIANSSFGTGSYYISDIYPQATMLNRDSNTSPNLAYGNAYVRQFNDATGTYGVEEISKGLFDTYYRNMMESLKRSPRVRTVHITLSISDIINLDFTKLIYIDGFYWRLNKIIDYNPSQNIPTKVELIEWFEKESYLPQDPMYGSSGSTVWNPNVDSETNDDIGL